MHAYLIMAHNNFYTLEILLRMIDDSRNDIFVHVDKKVESFDYNYYHAIVKKSKIYFVKRINVTWGEASQVECEMILMKETCLHGDYEFVHLLSGSDLPLKPQEEIHSFFSEHKENIFLHTATDKEVENELWKLSEYHLEKKQKNRKIHYIWNSFFIIKFSHHNRMKKYKKIIVAKSANWFSMPGECVRFVVSKEKFIKKMTNHTVCGDEFFVATVLRNSHYWSNVYKYEDVRGHMRYIDWENGSGNSPKILVVDDFDKLVQSGMFWARKFDENVDKEIINKVFTHVMGKCEDV